VTPRALLLCCLLPLAACQPGPAATPDAFDAWSAARRNELAAYQAFLRRHGVDEVVPARELLRLGRRWQACGGQAFALPPRERWAALVPTLVLLRDLRREGLLVDWRAVSGYRPDAYNRCEGGSPRSRHLHNLAIDLETVGTPDPARLCAAWRRLGPRRAWGLGFYAPNRIHLDTAGYRTWGYSYRAGSSLCAAPPTAG
jgi:hypothetical protein